MKFFLALFYILFSPFAMAVSSQDCPKSYFGISNSSPAKTDNPDLQAVIKNKYDSIGMFFDGLAVVGKNCKYGFIDEKGREIVSLKFDSVSDFSSGFDNEPNQIILKGKAWFINTKGEKVFDNGYDEIYGFREGLAAVKKNGKWGFINTKGELVVPYKYDTGNYFYEGLANVRRDKQLLFVDSTGQEVIKLNYDDVGDFTEGLAPVVKNKKWGYIDKTGKEVIAVKYDSGSDFGDGLAFVSLKGKMIVIDKKGNFIENYDSYEKKLVKP